MLWLYVNNKGADQPAHPCSLISTFVVRYLVSYIYLLNPKFGVWEKESIIEDSKSQPSGPPLSWETWNRLVSHLNAGPSGWDFPVSNEHQWYILFIWYSRQKCRLSINEFTVSALFCEQFSLRISENSIIKQTIILDAGCPYLKFETEVRKVLTFFWLVSLNWEQGKQCRPDQTPQNAASDQGI